MPRPPIPKDGPLLLHSLFYTAGVLGDGCEALGHGKLGQLTGEKQTDGGLDLDCVTMSMYSLQQIVCEKSEHNERRDRCNI